MLFTALQFSQALTYLDTAQQEVKASLGTHSDMLKQVSHIIMIYIYIEGALSVYISLHIGQVFTLCSLHAGWVDLSADFMCCSYLIHAVNGVQNMSLVMVHSFAVLLQKV